MAKPLCDRGPRRAGERRAAVEGTVSLRKFTSVLALGTHAVVSSDRVVKLTVGHGPPIPEHAG